jgi:hypothetical protein
MSNWSILALDTGQTTGWAHSSGVYGKHTFEKRPWRHPFAHYLDFRGWLLGMIDQFQVGRIGYEATLAGSGFGHGTRAEWQGIIHSVAAERDLPMLGVFPSQLKKYMTGDGRAEKPAMLQAVRERFGIDFAPEDHDAAEAVCVLSWVTWKAGEGEFERDWSGNPPGRGMGRMQICNRCMTMIEGGLSCPVCGGIHLRWAADDGEQPKPF